MKGFHDDIEKLTLAGEHFRRVLYTGEHLQLVLMTLQPGEEIGSEVHEDRDQFFRFEEGAGKVDVDDSSYDVVDGSGVIVPAGARHNVRNTGDGPLKLYTLYGPPEHKDGITQSTKAEAEARHHDEEWDGETTE
ncbi:cupin domain-containing protein [Sphingomonas sp. HDW15A]|uniref:cupin domain-containing protein n=1 Tax=Sphingomonas sp. HDW15A TaxID=2714942 RepID=UPI00140D1C0E|nr:cupin domain-containing protein [Sphingomonas sp. HDW15A]QIK96540.1 cupin domain-containing protein [Sphingomonas sp. HDW15A]